MGKVVEGAWLYQMVLKGFSSLNNSTINTITAPPGEGSTHPIALFPHNTPALPQRRGPPEGAEQGREEQEAVAAAAITP